ncbi:DUF6809 family protein [uncultured Dysosmobacter sp.]|uniref:DUF6809 family protein n=1 Tax=uncultured Dysosmobacter sp. TaxID=2591384 RepID=UPI00263A314A|nr:DUF6809 family protein [uncultured Dysosmobacter sp.]
MTDLMETLYSYTLNTSFTGLLCTDAYRSLNALLDRLDGELRQKLAAGGEEVLETYQDALAEQRDLDLAAMFQAAFSLARELK